MAAMSHTEHILYGCKWLVSNETLYQIFSAARYIKIIHFKNIRSDIQNILTLTNTVYACF